MCYEVLQFMAKLTHSVAVSCPSIPIVLPFHLREPHGLEGERDAGYGGNRVDCMGGWACAFGMLNDTSIRVSRRVYTTEIPLPYSPKPHRDRYR